MGKSGIMNINPSNDRAEVIHFENITIIDNPVGDITDMFPADNRTDLTIVVVSNGIFECTVNHTHYYVSPVNIALFPEISHIRQVRTSDDFKGLVLKFDYTFENGIRLGFSNTIKWKTSRDLMVKRIEKREIKAFRLYMELIEENISDAENDLTHYEICRLLFKALFTKCFSFFGETPTEKASDIVNSRKDYISKQFIKLVKENGTSNRDLGYYADKLCITTKYLSSVISKTTGKKALQWIEDNVVTQAMQMLKSTDMNISQIAETLNFQTQSDFCRCFKKNTGITPREYRAMM